MKKELFLTLSFIAITPQMTKTGNDYPYAWLVGAVIVGGCFYKWYNSSQEQQLPNNNNVSTEDPQENQPQQPHLTDFQTDPDKPTFADLTNIQTNQENPTLAGLTNSQKDKEQPFLNNNAPIENPQIDQKKPIPTFVDLQHHPINKLPEPKDRNELPYQQNLPQQQKKIPALQTITQNLEKVLKKDESLEKVLKQLLKGKFD